MSKWQEEENDPWPVRYAVHAPPHAPEPRLRKSATRRWIGTGKIDAGGIHKRLLWFLLAAEIGMALVAACVLPLVFLRLPIQDQGVLGAILTEVGRLLDLSSQATCLVLALPISFLVLSLGLGLTWLYKIHSQAKETDNQTVNE